MGRSKAQRSKFWGSGHSARRQLLSGRGGREQAERPTLEMDQGCRICVNGVVLAVGRLLPVYLCESTFTVSDTMSQMGDIRTFRDRQLSAQSGRSTPHRFWPSPHFLQASKTVFAIKQIEDSPHD
jgi:hypothetical protein